ncbi:MAG TPA: hypothetical protein DCX32_03285 [Candidatus Moranbacteria bacterium]|nr:hypothetical protein [Candidatus Moranbacteria bacterium]
MTKTQFLEEISDMPSYAMSRAERVAERNEGEAAAHYDDDERAKRRDFVITYPNMRSFCPLPHYISIEEKGKNLG